MDGAVKKGNGNTYLFLVVGFIVLGAGLVMDQPFGLIGIALILYAGVPPLWRMLFGSSGIVTVEDWLATLPECRHKFGRGYYGIAMDEAKSELHLFDNGYSKIYPFSDIREFTTNVATGGKYITGGIAALNMTAAGRANRAQEKENQEETGLFITVKDIDRPIWRIRFADDVQDEAKLQTRWMEIFRQVVNKN
jgi:hypothetical protein